MDDRIDLVLAVDELLERRALERELTPHCTVHAADDAREVLKLCLETVADVAVISSEFGGPGGGELLCRQIKDSSGGRQCSVIMVCGRDEPLKATSGADGRADEVLLRPLHPPEVLIRLATIHRLRRYATEVVQSSRLDPLTSVFTHAHLLERLRHEIERAARYGRCLCLMLADVDGFAATNKRLGTRHGDQLLREVARALVSRVRGVDLVARSGPDEFAVLLPETSLLVARPVGERLRAAIGAIELPDDGGSLSASLGVVGVPHPALKDAPEMLRCAREALDSARSAGGDRVALY